MITTAVRTSDLSKCVFRCKENVVCGHCGNKFNAKHYISECQDSLYLRRALASTIPAETLIHGTEEERERATLKCIANNEEFLSKTIKDYPIKAKCPEGHPILKNYGWQRFSNPFGKQQPSKNHSKSPQLELSEANPSGTNDVTKTK